MDRELIKELTGAEDCRIAVSDDGFLSRGYVIDGGRMVFKFKKDPSVTYQNEIRVLNFLNGLKPDINLQRVGWTSAEDRYLGLYGVMGRSLEQLTLTGEQKQDVGRQLGRFLKELHAADPGREMVCPLAEEIAAWQRRYRKGLPVLERYFAPAQLARIHRFMLEELPRSLEGLGEKPVFSHGDLGEGNVFLDDGGRVGVIDFNESGWLDEAADFMDIEDEALREAMLRHYGADEGLRRKVALRRAARPMFVIGTYAPRGEAAVGKQVAQIRRWLEKSWE